MKKGENPGYPGDKRKNLVLEHGYDAKNATRLPRSETRSVDGDSPDTTRKTRLKWATFGYPHSTEICLMGLSEEINSILACAIRAARRYDATDTPKLARNSRHMW
jgi:hypothetical protein